MLPGGAGCAGCCWWSQSRGETCQCLCFCFAVPLAFSGLGQTCPALFPLVLTWTQRTGWSQSCSHTWHSRRATQREKWALYYHHHYFHHCEKLKSKITNYKRVHVDMFSQCFNVGECLRVFGDHISQDMLHTCCHFFHRWQTWHKTNTDTTKLSNPIPDHWVNSSNIIHSSQSVHNK